MARSAAQNGVEDEDIEGGGGRREGKGRGVVHLGRRRLTFFLSQQIAEFFRSLLGLQRLMTTSAASSSYFFNTDNDQK